MSSADEDVEEFARIIPAGTEAENALDLVCEGEVDDHHRLFIRVERRTRSEDSGSEHSGSERRSPAPGYWGGYYKLSLGDPVKKPFSIGWLMGKGHARDFEGPPRGVDLLVIRPGRKAYGVAPVHARISIHPQSGVLLLFGVQEGKPVVYKDHNSSKDVELTNGQSHVLYQPQNTFSIGHLSYTLVFTEFDKTRYFRFVEKRNAIMRAHGLLAPHGALSAIPRREDTKRGRVVTHGTLSAGGFGWVSSGVHAATGVPLAIKEHKAKDLRAQDNVVRELKVGKLFTEQQGLLPSYRGWCEHELNDICGTLPQSIFTSSPLAVSDFRGVPWDNLDTQQIMMFFRGPLQGLATLHSHGYIHRDVHRGNLFVMAIEPPRAVLGDFGKTIQAVSDVSPHLGPAPTRAPEVDGRQAYTNKIDIWSLGFAMIEALLPQVASPRGVVTKEWHQNALGALDHMPRLSAYEGVAADLIRRMLVHDPAKRISAAEALQHRCFRPNQFPPSQPPPAPPSQSSQRSPPPLPQPGPVLPLAPYFPGPRQPRSWVAREATSSTPMRSSSSQGATGASMLAYHQQRAAQLLQNPQGPRDGLLRRR
ncbi:MAG: hypothetical protein L6R39_000764 [Caloplaca ligustica]|nr:MAG: hypothetical protein L6R39_000764 [Caloplaca ligustica]